PRLAEVYAVRLLVLGNHEGWAFLLWHLHPYDLALEGARGDRLTSPPVALQREVVQLLPRELVLLGAQLASVAHVEVVVHVPQAVLDEAVGQFAVPEAIALARLLQQVRRARHILHAAGHHDPRLAHADRPGRHDGGHNTGAADLVHRRRAHRRRDARADRGLSGRRLAKTRAEHAAHVDFV